MEISLLKVLLNNISSFSHLSSFENVNSGVAQKYFQKAEEIFKLLRPILDSVVDCEIASNEVLHKGFSELSQYIDELRELFETCQPLSSKVYLALQTESLLSKIRNSGLDIFEFLKSTDEHLPEELSSSSIEFCIQKIKQLGLEQTSSTVKEALNDQVENVGTGSDILVRIAESLSLRTNQEILIEAVALEKLKETAEQAEKNGEVEFFDQLIALVTRMHERLVVIKQSQSSSPVPIPPDFCCPLSLELMTDPVIVASGQTYERAFIKSWIELGLTVCPKTRHTLGHTNLIPNYTVKALIANWCDINKVKLPDPVKSVQPSPILVHLGSGSPKDNSLPHSRTRQPITAEPTKSVSSSGFSPAGFLREGRSPIRSPIHPRSTSDSSLYGIVGNGQGHDIGAEERFGNSEESIIDSIVQPSASPSRMDVSDASASASGPITNGTYSRGSSGDASDSLEVSNHLTSYNSDTSGEVKAEPLVVSAASNSSRAEPIFSPRFAPSGMEVSDAVRVSMEKRAVASVAEASASPSGMEVSDAVAATDETLFSVETQVRRLVGDLGSSNIDTQREATAHIRELAKNNMDNRIVIADCGAITLLVSLLRSTDRKVQENAVTALLNLSINGNNKTAIADAEAIEPLIYVLKTGSPEGKENSAATLFSLSIVDENKARIARLGAIEPLVDLLRNGTPSGKKDAAIALFNLSISEENKARVVDAGAVKHLVKLMDPAAGVVDKAVAFLANLATIPEGSNAIGEQGGIPVLVEAVELGSARGKENAAAALLQLCTNSNRFCNTVLQQGVVPPLMALSKSGTPRAKEKAQLLLSYFKNQRHGNAGRN
ncbi:U-box domain-containing protein 4 [Linum grandiflorum]